AIEPPMKCRCASLLMLLGLAGWVVGPAGADVFELNDKTTLTGQPLAPDKNGILIKDEAGKISERVPWTNFTQTALKTISELPTRILPTGAELAEQQLAQEELVHAAEAAGEPALAHAETHGATPAPVAAPRHPPPTVYQRGHTTFNRRFFETKLSGFMRIVPS